MRDIKFSFADLEVWQRAIAFAENAIVLTENIKSSQKH
jgi:hypothetical protein